MTSPFLRRFPSTRMRRMRRSAFSRRLDVDALVDRALQAGRTASPAERAIGEVRLALDGTLLIPTVTFDEPALRAAIAAALPPWCPFTRIEKTADGLVGHTRGGRALEADQIMFAIGRKPNIEGLGLVETGVALGWNGHVIVDEYSRSSVPSIYAVGDVTDRVALTPVAIREGHAFADTGASQPFALDQGLKRGVFGEFGITSAQQRAHFLEQAFLARRGHRKGDALGRDKFIDVHGLQRQTIYLSCEAPR